MIKLPTNPDEVEDWEEYPHPYNQNAEGIEDEEGCLVCTVCGDHAASPWHEGEGTFES